METPAREAVYKSAIAEFGSAEALTTGRLRDAFTDQLPLLARTQLSGKDLETAFNKAHRQFKGQPVNAVNLQSKSAAWHSSKVYPWRAGSKR